MTRGRGPARAWSGRERTPTPRPRRRAWKFVTVIGRSMEPALRSGDVLLVDTAEQPPAPGDIVVFRRTAGDGRTALIVKVVIGTAGGRLRVAGTGVSQTSEQLGPVHPEEVVGIARRIVSPMARWRRLRPLDGATWMTPG